jgi:valyl-tRNA synthetase
MELPKHYDASSAEANWYAHWEKQGYFHSEPDDRPAFSVVIPPPNVTGVLHMGHMLNNTIQDVLVRRARLQGYNACWVPGTDHASIATEAKVVKQLREKGIKKTDIGREEFLKHAFEWKDKYGGIILDQLKMLGASCDWERTRFTMEPKLSKAVIQVFIDLYKKGMIYRGLRMINWDPEALTALSNEEVIYKEEASKLYQLRYQVEGTDEWIIIATTRPETILGDSAIAVHPDDERYTHLKGKSAIVPLIGRSIPIIFDSYVDMEFGTGALKVTPAHDMNDNEIGERHNLEVIDIFHDNGRMHPNAQFYVGMDRFEVRKQIAKDLKAQGHLVKVENYTNKVGRSERTDAVIEPRLKEQWFLNMEELSATALKAVESGEVNFFPEHMLNMYRNWLKPENVRDWCISRQLWWGQQIPAWYDAEENFVVAETEEEALAEFKKQGKDYTAEDIKQDEDVVDTWFSSWLWPISVFDGFENQEELKYYYPTNVLVTGWDIMFFWVARMIMAGYEWAGDLLGEELAKEKGIRPFNDVYFTGMVRDKLRRKMSKSLGNSPDSIELMKKYSADGVRFGILSCSAAGNDVIFDAPFADKEKTSIKNESKLCEQGSNFNNKMWNALKLIKSWEIVDEAATEGNKFAMKWMEQKFNEAVEKTNASFDQYRLSEAVMGLRELIWDNFCSWYIEMIKPDFQKPIDRETLDFTINIFEKMMTLLHPFMPFITEEIWSKLKDRAEGEDCVVSTWPEGGNYDKEFLYQVSIMQDVVKNVRDLRQKNNLKKHELLKLFVKDSDSAQKLYAVDGLKEALFSIGVLESLTFTAEDQNMASFIAGTEQYFLEFEVEIDVAAELDRLAKELAREEGTIKGIQKKLGNARFVDNAPAEVVDKERKKLADKEARIELLKAEIDKLNKLN